MSAGGGGQGLSVIPGEVTAVGRYAYDLADTLRSALDRAGRDVESLTKGDWTGNAADSFGKGWVECAEGGHQILDALGGLAAALGVTSETYGAHDNQLAAEVSSLDLP